MRLVPRARYDQPATSVVVLRRGESPTCDIYMRKRLAGARMPVRYIDIADPAHRDADPASLLPDGSFVILVRYLNRRFARILSARAAVLAGLAYLLDDDITGAWADRALPWRYALELGIHQLRFGRTLEHLASELWVASDGLLAKHAGASVFRINPMFVEGASASANEAAVSVAYHGEVSHRGDAMWLAEVARAVQARSANILFEVTGRVEVQRAFLGIPRCRIVHPMTWSAYLAYSTQVRFDIGLAPLRPTPFNAARSFNKLYDITRLGAVGIYAEAPPYAEVIEHGRNGLLVPHDAAAWADAILALAADAPLRQRMFAEALNDCRALSEREVGHPLVVRFF
jgi:hypothetical protein